MVLRAQLCSAPAVIAVKRPAGGIASPALLSPQHASVPLARRAQLSALPALTAVNRPVGGVVWPAKLEPQHASVPLVFSPHV